MDNATSNFETHTIFPTFETKANTYHKNIRLYKKIGKSIGDATLYQSTSKMKFPGQDSFIYRPKILNSYRKSSSNISVPKRFPNDKDASTSPENTSKKLLVKALNRANLTAINFRKLKKQQNDSEIYNTSRGTIYNTENVENSSQRLLNSISMQILQLKKDSSIPQTKNKTDDSFKKDDEYTKEDQSKSIDTQASNKKSKTSNSNTDHLAPNTDRILGGVLAKSGRKNFHKRFQTPNITATATTEPISKPLQNSYPLVSMDPIPYSNGYMRSLIVLPDKDMIKPLDKNTDFKSFNDIYFEYKSGALRDSMYVKTIEAFLELDKTKTGMMMNTSNNIEKKSSESKERAMFILQKELEFNKLQASSVERILHPKEVSKSAYMTHEEFKKKLEKMPKVKIHSKKKVEEELPSIKDPMILVQANSIFTFFWYSPEEDPLTNGVRPEAREGGVICSVGKYIVLFGGASKCLMDDVWCFDISKKTWKRQIVSGDQPQGRHGHVAAAYKSKYLLIYGGESGYNSLMKMRQCLRDVRLFNLQTREWTFLSSSLNAEPRRNHSIAIKGDNVYIYGGLDPSGKVLNDLWRFNLQNNSWTLIAHENEDPDSHGLAYHSAEFVGADKAFDQKIPYEGIYVFGGKDGENKVTNIFKIYDLSQKKWVYPKTKGLAPYPRYKHSMSFYQPGMLLIIYGGKNEALYGKEGTTLLSDMKVLDVQTLTWYTASCKGHLPDTPRHYHSATIYGSNLYIFGGMNESTYSNADIRIVELDTLLSRKLIRDKKVQHSNNNNNNENYNGDGLGNGGDYDDNDDSSSDADDIMNFDTKRRNGIYTYLPVKKRPSDIEKLQSSLRGTKKMFYRRNGNKDSVRESIDFSDIENLTNLNFDENNPVE